jgi:hypothetical protein
MHLRPRRVPRPPAPASILPSVVAPTLASQHWPTSTPEPPPASPLATPPPGATAFDWIKNQHLKIRSIGSKYKPRLGSCTSTRLNSSALLREPARQHGSTLSSCLDQAEPVPRIGMPPWSPTMPPPQPEPRCPAFDPVLPPSSLRLPAPWTPPRADLICLEVHELGSVPPEPNLVPPSPRSSVPWMSPPPRAYPICLEVHELPSSP